MSELIRELQEDMKREKWLLIWQRYGRLLMALIAGVILLATVYLAWQAYQHAANENDTTTLLDAVRDPDAESFAKAADQTDGVHEGLARLIQAQLLASEGDQKASQAVLASLAKESKQMPGQLARALIAEGNNVGKRHKIFPYTALENTGWRALEAQNFEAATRAFTSVLTAEQAAESAKERARTALAYIQSHQPPASSAEPSETSRE